MRYYDFYYDPSRQGYDTNDWKTLNGSPTTSSGNLRLNSAEIINYSDIKGGYHTIKVSVPAVDSSTSKFFGLSSGNLGHKAYFEIRDGDLVAVTESEKGKTETIIPWDTSWEGAMTDFEIDLSGRQVAFKVNSNVKAIHDDDNYPEGAMSWYANNTNADDMDIAYFQVKNGENLVK